MNKLQKIQIALKAPKSQHNTFGGYNYRSCEDILNAVKPLLAEHDAMIIMTDDIVLIGDRYYVKATATFHSREFIHSVSAFAREALIKKGMDESQITGSCSSYARKYALNGLLLIDDTKDADHTNKGEDEKKPETTSIASGEAPKCPKCQGAMWDNRGKKKDGKLKPNAPDFKCKNKECDGVIWPQKEKKKLPDDCPENPYNCDFSTFDDGKPLCGKLGDKTCPATGLA